MAEKSGLGQASSVNKSLDASRGGNRDRPDRASLPVSLGTTTMDARTEREDRNSNQHYMKPKGN